MHSIKTILAYLTLPVALLAQSEPGEISPPPSAPIPTEAAPAEAARELAARQAELDKVTEEIGGIQRRAETSTEVQALRSKYREVLQTEMVRTAPELQADVTRQAQLVDELTARPADANGAPALPDQEAKLAEFRELRARLLPVEESVQDVEAVKTARKEYFDAMVAEMRRIEPRTEDLLAKHRELVAVVRELSAQAHSS